MNQTPTPNRFLKKAIGLSVLSAVIGLSAAQHVQAQTTPINISGFVYDDADGRNNGDIINGTLISNLGGSNQLYVYLTRNTFAGNEVVSKATVSGGAYTVTGFNNTNYAIRVSTSNVLVGAVDPTFGMPETWIATSEGYPPNGEPTSVANQDNFVFTFTTASTQAQQQDVYFGIDRRPVGGDFIVTSPMLDGPNGGRMVVPAAAISGADLEDAPTGYPAGLAGRSVEFSPPVGAQLYYNNVLVTFPGNQPIIISNFDVTKLTVDGNFGAMMAQLFYRPIDNASIGALQSSTVTYPVILAIKLSSFDVVKTGTGSSRVKWEVASERDNAYFDVQRSTDGRSFSSIGKVDSKSGGNSTTASSYELNDNALPAVAAVYYRLRMVDVYGKEQYSDIARISGASGSGQVNTFPNPAVNAINFDLSNFTGTSTISILDGSGRVVASSTAEGGRVASISLANLSAGRYFYQVTNGQSNAVTSSFVVAK